LRIPNYITGIDAKENPLEARANATSLNVYLMYYYKRLKKKRENKHFIREDFPCVGLLFNDSA
jgi:hypothetical protein